MEIFDDLLEESSRIRAECRISRQISQEVRHEFRAFVDRMHIDRPGIPRRSKSAVDIPIPPHPGAY